MPKLFCIFVVYTCIFVAKLTIMKPYKTSEPTTEQVNEALVGYVKTFDRAKNIKPKDISYSTFLTDKLLVAMAIRKGVTKQLFDEIKFNSPFNDNQWSEFLNINIRTLQRYKNDANHIFKPLQSERIFELAEVISVGNSIFDTPEYFQFWLNSPSVALGNETPVSLLDSSYGKELVLAELNRIEHGIFV